MSGRLVDRGARHLTPVAVLLVLTALLLLALSPPCPPAGDSAGGTLPVTMSSAAAPVEDGGGHVSCTAASDLVSATTRCAEAPRLDVDLDDSRAPSGPKAGPARLHILTGAREPRRQPRGRDLLLVLEIARN